MNLRLHTYIILLAMPVFFVSNLIIGKPAVEIVPPWTLAALRWTLACLLLAPFVWTDLRTHHLALAAQWRRITLLGFLGMWVCGGIVYVALRYTTATHGTLIYTGSPVLVVLIAAIMARRHVPVTQVIGIALAIASVFVIVLEGDPRKLLEHRINAGDLLFVVAAIAWAFYSLLLKHPPFEPIPTLVVFSAIAASGALLLWPCMAIELATGHPFPSSGPAWFSIGGIVIFSSVLSYALYQFGVKAVGPAVTSVFMYLLPCYGVILAVLLLGEPFRLYHAVALVLVIAGLLLATGPDLWAAILRPHKP